MVRIELKNKFRRSKLGILWTVLSPLCLTAIMSVVFAIVFDYDIVTYAPYILAGNLFWEVLSASFMGGGFVFIANDAYIRQFNHPMSIYTLKSAIVYTISFSIASLSLVVWTVFVTPQNLFAVALSFPLTVVILFFLAWGAITISAYTNTKYRDYPQLVPLVLQTIWYISPVFFKEEMFMLNDLLYAWFKINPITHMLNLLRSPFLYGELPSIESYLISMGCVAVICILAVKINNKNEKQIIFYI